MQHKYSFLHKVFYYRIVAMYRFPMVSAQTLKDPRFKIKGDTLMPQGDLWRQSITIT